MYTAVILAALFVILIVSAIGMFYYVFAIPEPEGLSLASWPNTFTNNFSFWIEEKDGSIGVKQTGLKRLDEYGLWVQIVDETGQEIFSHNKPTNYPESYSMAELVTLSENKYENGYTVFISDITFSDRTFNYVVGFPYAIGKAMLYYNGENVARLSPFTKNSDGSSLDLQTAQDYGEIILKNVNHIEKLMNDLKLTYQLEAGAIPYNPQEIRIVRFLKELVIDIVNDPAFEKRTIEFESELPELMIAVDPDLLRRAVGNIVINALVHNPLDTKVKITVTKAPNGSLSISICDNGNGMDEAELSGLWSRYYRGTNTKERPEGSGLGLAIAKQIITLHNGDISVKSSPGVGTEFIILLPLGTDAN